MEIGIPSTNQKIKITWQHVFACLIADLVITFASMALLLLAFGFEGMTDPSKIVSVTSNTSFLFPILVFLTFLWLSKDREIKNGLSLALVFFIFTLIIVILSGAFALLLELYPYSADYFLRSILNVVYTAISSAVIYCGLFSALDRKNRERGIAGLIAMPVIWFIIIYLISPDWLKPNPFSLEWWPSRIGIVGMLALDGFAIGALVPRIKQFWRGLSDEATYVGFPAIFGFMTVLFDVAEAGLGSPITGSTDSMMTGVLTFLQYIIFGVIIYLLRDSAAK